MDLLTNLQLVFIIDWHERVLVYFAWVHPLSSDTLRHSHVWHVA